jgi:hypothetical protein
LCIEVLDKSVLKQDCGVAEKWVGVILNVFLDFELTLGDKVAQLAPFFLVSLQFVQQETFVDLLDHTCSVGLA